MEANNIVPIFLLTLYLYIFISSELCTGGEGSCTKFNFELYVKVTVLGYPYRKKVVLQHLYTYVWMVFYIAKTHK